MPEDSLQAAARLARRVPGYRWVRRRTVPRIRQSAVAQALVHRIFPSQSNGSQPLAEVAPGRLLAGIGIDQLPVVLLSLLGQADGAADNPMTGQIIDAVIDEVAELQLLGAGFRPVFLLDTPAFGRARSYGYLVEFVTPAATWFGESTGWPDYIAARVASMAKAYGISAVVTVGRDGLDVVARGVLRSYG